MKLTPAVATDILGTANEAIIVVDGDGHIVFANAKAENLFGYGTGELIGESVETLMPEAFRHRHEQHRKRYKKSPHARPLVSGLKLQGMRKDGNVFDAEIALTPVESEGQLFVSSTVRDITVSDTSEAYFRNLLEAAPDAMVIIDQNGRIAVVNGQAEHMFGYARQEMLGQPVEMLLPAELRDKHVRHRATYVSDPHLRPMGIGMDLMAKRRDGSTFPVEISLNAIDAANGQYVSSVIRDITTRKEMQDELIAARQEAERANKANSAFLAAASHDLRQPVQALSLLAGALRRTAKEPLVLEMVESQQHSLDAMTNLLNSLLDISRLDAGAVQPEFEEFPIQRLVDRLSAELSRQALHKNLTFSSCKSDAIVRSDPNMLGEIVQNLVSNAIQYTDQGSVSLRCRVQNGLLELSITDTGIGIEQDQLDMIFDEFHQIKTPGREKEGFGLGLAIVRRMADLLGHEISAESTPGKGSTFSVLMPVVERTTRSKRPSGKKQPDAPQAPASGLIVLIEDDVQVANAWGLLLEAEGFEVATAASANEARAVAEHLAEVPDLIISDFYLLDGSTGVDAVAEIRDKFACNIPAFIVSGDTSKMVKQARNTENCTIMNKPVNTDHLLSTAKQAIATGIVPSD
ncbi:MAG: PAS domain S-box protein [Woeseiaceae bacterium]|nr:PAS domain S-box protein [Woeseiaceae bacterium]